MQRGQKINLHPDVIRERYMQLKQAIEHPEVSRWFRGFKRVVTERDLWDKQRGRHYRPDRVVWTADGHIDVVDFKFGDPGNYESYERQVRNYVSRLRQAGYRNLRGYLWYPLDNYIHTVVDDEENSLI